MLLLPNGELIRCVTIIIGSMISSQWVWYEKKPRENRMVYRAVEATPPSLVSSPFISFEPYSLSLMM
jgi:hypothetical protein